ncbi:MAG: glycoside hydrolase family 15 protein [Candidatus Syntropharchaeia archaeon]
MIREKDLIETTKVVIKDASVENGAIVAANTDKKYYPRDVSCYRYVWVRDASFTCVAADILGIEIQEEFFQWCLERAEGFDRDGVFYQRYHTNGAKAGEQFQPDQTGTLLWAIWHHYQERIEDAAEFEELIEKAADGICKRWNGDHFIVETYDLWEERCSFPDLKENHTYSLAACTMGLKCADKMVNKGEKNKRWLRCASEIEKTIDKGYDMKRKYFLRTFGRINDSTVDASLLGLVYPFEVCDANDPRMRNTVDAMEERIVRYGGIHRYENDVYDGWMQDGRLRCKGAGAWPLLNFWISIYYVRRGDRKKARKYREWVLNRLETPYIPEQIFKNDLQKSVCPLVWSHAMFVLSLEKDYMKRDKYEWEK